MAGAGTRTHVLITLGALFTIGGLTRVLPSTLASAEETVEEHASDADVHGETVAAAYSLSDDDAASDDRICLTGTAAEALASDQEALKARADALQEQEFALRTRSQELERQAAELAALKTTIDDRWKSMATSADGDIEHLAQMYSAMKPDQAAGIFNQMDPGFAAGFLRLMPSDQAGLILAGMNTDKAYVVSVKLASKNGDIRSASTPQ
ncbi:hypothetical protein WNY37_18060 [Henriciella sp. AS95]|uniref:MotE family protein n=1 Tax=Henriciella sp. AS95 TaxID=3135782 RepID=UPI003176E333